MDSQELRKRREGRVSKRRRKARLEVREATEGKGGLIATE